MGNIDKNPKVALRNKATEDGLRAGREALKAEVREKTAELRKSEDRFVRFMNSIPDVVVLKDGDFRYIFANPGFESFIGKKAADILGKTDEELLPRELADQCRESDIRGMKEPVVLEEKAGDRVFETRKFPVELENGKTGVGAMIRDVTQRKRAEETLRDQQALLAAIYRNAPLVLMVVNSERRIQQVNGFAAQFAGRDVEEMLGLRGGEALRCLHALDDPQGCGFGDYCRQCVIRNTVLDTLKTGETHLQVEAPYHFLKDENVVQEMTFLASTTPITVKDECMVLVTLQDITERKRAEEKTAEQFRELQRWQDITLGREDRVIELKKEVNDLLALLDRPPRYPSTMESEEK